jgi:hypothetical protein
MPAGGWPLVVYGHGTGGSFRSGIELARVVDGAMLAIDLPQHGARRGASMRGSDVLFFNFVNPRAARDNVMQGAADLLSLVYFASAGGIAAADSPTTQAIDFDPSRIVYLGHSQGSTHGALVVPYEPDIRAVVFSGLGGDLTQSLLNKTEPIDIAGVLPFALLDPDAGGRLTTGDFHPALALFQAYFERVDPVNYAWHLFRAPPAGDTGRDVLMTYGPGDSYSPEATMQAYSIAAGLPIVRPVLVDYGLPQVDAPLRNNVTVGGVMHSAGLRQYTPDAGEDGHFVATGTTDGRRDVVTFIDDALAGNVPAIGIP